MNKSEKLEPHSLMQPLPPASGDSLSPPGCDLAELRKLAANLRARTHLSGPAPIQHRGPWNLVVFSGPSSTGKTMAAQALARELGAEAFRIDASRVVSKYIGETEKNLSAVFTKAAGSHAILFFDEGDALFGKRSEVKDSHDRYANIELNFLLQQTGAYPGIVILACNQAGRLDAANVVKFPARHG